MPLDKRILEELIYEQVKLSVDLCKLMSFEADLAVSVDRALHKCARSADERRLLAARYLRRAWKRVGRDLVDLMVHEPQLARSVVDETDDTEAGAA